MLSRETLHGQCFVWDVVAGRRRITLGNPSVSGRS